MAATLAQEAALDHDGYLTGLSGIGAEPEALVAAEARAGCALSGTAHGPCPRRRVDRTPSIPGALLEKGPSFSSCRKRTPRPGLRRNVGSSRRGVRSLALQNRLYDASSSTIA